MTTTAAKAASGSTGNIKYLIVAVLVAGAFFGAYRFAAARNAEPLATAGGGGINSPVPAAAGDPSAGGAACACCGGGAPTEGGVTGDLAEGTAVVDGDVQRIDVDLSSGYYQPNAIKLKAGVPAEITFGQGAGCTAQVMSNELGFFEDLTAGPRTVKLPALEKGEYPFYCGMQMVFGKIVVE